MISFDIWERCTRSLLTANFFPPPTATLFWKGHRETTTCLLWLLSKSWWTFWFQTLSSHLFVSSCKSFRMSHFWNALGKNRSYSTFIRKRLGISNLNPVVTQKWFIETRHDCSQEHLLCIWLTCFSVGGMCGFNAWVNKGTPYGVTPVKMASISQECKTATKKREKLHISLK